MGNVLLCVKHAELDRRCAEQLAQFARESDDPFTNRPVAGATAPGDERRLRGIPAIGRGVAGAIPGTKPGSVR